MDRIGEEEEEKAARDDGQQGDQELQPGSLVNVMTIWKGKWNDSQEIETGNFNEQRESESEIIRNGKWNGLKGNQESESWVFIDQKGKVKLPRNQSV